MDDNFRIVYTMIMKTLNFIQLRDRDALHLLNTRDYELIKLSFSRYVTKIKIGSRTQMKCSTYRKYNQAYYEEIIVNNQVESRVAMNYRQRFL